MQTGIEILRENKVRLGELIFIFVLFISGMIFVYNETKEQSIRTDKLFELYTEQQKNFDQKFYDILKENKGK